MIQQWKLVYKNVFDHDLLNQNLMRLNGKKNEELMELNEEINDSSQ
jgi:hypothetical protein